MIPLPERIRKLPKKLNNRVEKLRKKWCFVPPPPPPVSHFFSTTKEERIGKEGYGKKDLERRKDEEGSKEGYGKSSC
jgi:hypothetical protein